MTYTIDEVCARLGIVRGSLYRVLPSLEARGVLVTVAPHRRPRRFLAAPLDVYLARRQSLLGEASV